MKNRLLYFTLCLITGGCANSKEGHDTNSFVQNDVYLVGTISTEYREFGCDFLIKMDNSNLPALFSPVNLREEYKVDGMQIRFRFHYSDSQGSCDMARSITLDDIERLNL